MKAFSEVLEQVTEYNNIRLQMSAQICDNSAEIKEHVIDVCFKDYLFELLRGEDARILDDIDAMCDAFVDLFQLNQEILDEYHQRAQNHSNLTKALRVK